jgi:hypothetical protein
MSELLSQIFGNESHTPAQARDPNLMQGQRFDYMQNAITSGVLPSLPLMEQTTGPGLGSIVEPLETAEQSSNQYNSVTALNESEMGKLQEMENQYQTLIAQLIQLDSTSADPATYAKPTLCSELDQKYPVKGTPWAAGSNQGGNELGTGWINGVCPPNHCYNASYEWQCMLPESTNRPNVIRAQLRALNVKINASINKLIKQTEKTHTVNNTAKGTASTHAGNLRIQLNTLMEKKSRLDSLMAKRQTLRGQLEDRRHELDSSYLHYIAWFLSAVTLGALAFNKLAKN